MIMKKTYLKPETAVVSVVVKNFILDGSIVPGGGNEEAGEDVLGAGKHRGEWGNVWAK